MTSASPALADGGATAVSVWSALWALVFQEIPVAIFGVPLSVVFAGFAGAMAIVSFLPPFETRQKMWTTLIVCTLAAGYLTKLVIFLTKLDGAFSLAVAFGIGFLFQLVGTGIVQHAPRLWEAVLSRIGGPK